MLNQINKTRVIAQLDHQQFLVRVWRRQPGRFFCVSTRDTAWRDHFFMRSEFGLLWPFVRAQRDSDVYFCPHGFSYPTRRREFAVAPRLLWADLDAVDPRTIAWTPQVAIESSPGRYMGLWYTDTEVDDHLNKRMSYAVGADRGGWDFTQVLRVP